MTEKNTKRTVRTLEQRLEDIDAQRERLIERAAAEKAREKLKAAADDDVVGPVAKVYMGVTGRRLSALKAGDELQVNVFDRVLQPLREYLEAAGYLDTVS